RRKLLPGFGRIAKNQIKFTEVLVGAAVTPIEQYGFLIMLHRWAQLAQPAIGIADVILDIGVARVAQRRALERRDRPIPVLGETSACLPAAKSGSSCAQSASDPIDPMVVQIGHSSVASFAGGAGSDAPSQIAIALRQSGSLAKQSTPAATSAPRIAARAIDR